VFFIRGLQGKTTKTLAKATRVPARILNTMHVDRCLSLLYHEEELVFFLQTLVINYQAKGQLVSYGLFKQSCTLRLLISDNEQLIVL
jgi:hypothetical protein